ncbi:serine/threonine protein kinase [Bacillus sp. FJAT-42376]|uniref:serine/threonine protein kinase n=1 Tax=Bacillus sp. FJAT-42376 TaxID=2014076 RepID=UPI001F14FA42|nr:serine/threonine protein kinase [Bacillus sp. FJAT-42376]
MNIDLELTDKVSVKSVDPLDPVHVDNIPEGWELLGRGNYAAVFIHKDLPDKIVKLYAENREGAEKEQQVYRMLGKHPAYSEMYGYGDRYLILKKLEGLTLYEALRKGVYIPERVIKDVDKAIKYAIEEGLRPADIHGKNVMMKDGRGYIVDVSDFLEEFECPRWKDFKKAYYRIYLPLTKLGKWKIPRWMLERIRKGYQKYLKINGYYKRKKQSKETKRLAKRS